jgi:hypothetical protein
MAYTLKLPAPHAVALCCRCDRTIEANEHAILVRESPDYIPEKPVASKGVRYWMGLLDEEGNKACILLFICADCAPAFSHLAEYELDDEAPEWVN